MPFWISVWILSHWIRDTTGPMVVPSARGSPALVLSATPLAMAATSFIFDSGTIIRDGALHDCPELLNMCITPPVTAFARSAPSRMTFGDLPPSSWLTRFTVGAARLATSTPARVEPAERLGPRHYCFHPALDLVYFSNEQGCSVTGYRLDRPTGTLSAVQTITSLPAGFTARNTCSQIHLTPSGQFLYVANRGHNSIAGFAVDGTGHLTAVGHVSTEAVPSAFGLDPAGRFLFAAGTASGRLASYRINNETGTLSPLGTYAVGQRPAAVLAARLGD